MIFNSTEEVPRYYQAMAPDGEKEKKEDGVKEGGKRGKRLAHARALERD